MRLIAVALAALAGGGGGLACANLGALFLQGFGKKEGAERGPALLRTACDKGIPSACRTLASTLAQKQDFDSASKLADRACQAGDPEGCAVLGKMFEMSSDVLRAGVSYAKACEMGSSVGCYEQGMLLIRSGTDRGTGLKLLKKACSEGNQGACAAAHDPFL